MSTPVLRQLQGRPTRASTPYGAARGENFVPNDDLVGPIDSSDEWIRQRTGIVTRVRANKETDAIDLASEAAREAVERCSVSTRPRSTP